MGDSSEYFSSVLLLLIYWATHTAPLHISLISFSFLQKGLQFTLQKKY